MALNYPFVYGIFSWCAKGIVILFTFRCLLFGLDMGAGVCAGRTVGVTPTQSQTPTQSRAPPPYNIDRLCFGVSRGCVGVAPAVLNRRIIGSFPQGFAVLIAGLCGSNGGSKPPPYTIDRLILWSDDRPPKTLRCSARKRAIRCTHMVSAWREFDTRSVLCELPAFWSEECCFCAACGLSLCSPN